MKRVSDFIERIEIICSTIMMAAITCILFTSVLFRYFLNAPLYWANEASIFMMAWITFLGGSLGLKYHSQAAISFIIDRFNEWNQIKMKIATYIVILIALAVFIYISYDWIFSLTDTKDRKSTRLNSSHVAISYAVFCLKKKNKIKKHKQ